MFYCCGKKLKAFFIIKELFVQPHENRNDKSIFLEGFQPKFNLS